MKRLFMLFWLILIPMTGWAENASTLQPGDVLYIALPGEPEFNKTFEIDRNGRITLPEVGEVEIAGKTVQQAQSITLHELSKVYRDLSRLKVTLKEHRLLITVLGYVKSPGDVQLPAGANVQMAITSAGGLLPGAQMNSMQLKRGKEIIPFNYKQYLDTGDSKLIPKLEPLDVIFVPSSKLIGNVRVDFDAGTLTKGGDAPDVRDAVKVFGEVHNPGGYIYKPNATVLDYIMKAGGVTRFSEVNQIRIVNKDKPEIFNLKHYLETGDKSLLPTITPGTTIFIPHKSTAVQKGLNTIYVMGEVQKPGPYEVSSDSTFLDALANAGGPTRFSDLSTVKLMRADGSIIPFNLLAYTEGTSKVAPPQIAPGDTIFVPEEISTSKEDASWIQIHPSRSIKIMGAVNNPGRYEWANHMSLLDLVAHAGGPSPDADISKIKIVNPQSPTISFNLKRFITQGGSIRQLPRLLAGATVMVPEMPGSQTGEKGKWLTQAPSNSIYVFGAVTKPGRYAFDKRMNLLDVLSAADGPVEAADMRSIRIIHGNTTPPKVSKVNLSSYFETGDTSIIPFISAEDTIYIPSTNRNWLDKSNQSTVRIIGSVKNPGRYGFDDNMSILDLLAESGGPTSTALVERIVVINMSCCQDQSRRFNLEKFAKTGDISLIPVLRPGDTVYVPDLADSHWRRLIDGIRDLFLVAGTVTLVTGGI